MLGLIRSHKHLSLILIGMVLLAVIASSGYTSHLQFQKQDPRRYYGEIKLVPPIIHHGYSYHLDGGSIQMMLTDTNGVNLILSFSQPGEFQGDTHAFIGNRDQMWVALGVSDRSDIQPATKIERGTSTAKQVAKYVALATRNMDKQLRDAAPDTEWDRWHFREYARQNLLYGERIEHILTSPSPITDRWGPGEPHAQMPYCCD